jgi:hypothetical protein
MKYIIPTTKKHHQTTRYTESKLAITIPVIRRDLCLVNLKKKSHKASESSYYGKIKMRF